MFSQWHCSQNPVLCVHNKIQNTYAILAQSSQQEMTYTKVGPCIESCKGKFALSESLILASSYEITSRNDEIVWMMRTTRKFQQRKQCDGMNLVCKRIGWCSTIVLWKHKTSSWLMVRCSKCTLPEQCPHSLWTTPAETTHIKFSNIISQKIFKHDQVWIELHVLPAKHGHLPY